MNIYDMLESNGFNKGSNGLYFSPFNVGERTASLSVTPSGFGFKCHATGEAGGIDKIAKQLGVTEYTPTRSQKPIEKKQPRTIYLSHSHEVNDFKLVKYLKLRQMFHTSDYFHEVVALDTRYNKKYTYLGVKNVNGGWACRNAMDKMGKISLGSQGISVFKNENSDKWLVAEGAFSGLSLFELKLRKGGKREDLPNLLILNSVSNLKYAMEYLSTVSTENILLALDNDTAGDLATLEFGGAVKDIRYLYKEYKDANDLLMRSKISKNTIRVVGDNGKYKLYLAGKMIHESIWSIKELKKFVNEVRSEKEKN